MIIVAIIIIIIIIKKDKYSQTNVVMSVIGRKQIIKGCRK